MSLSSVSGLEIGGKGVNVAGVRNCEPGSKKGDSIGASAPLAVTGAAAAAAPATVEVRFPPPASPKGGDEGAAAALRRRPLGGDVGDAEVVPEVLSEAGCGGGVGERRGFFVGDESVGGGDGV